MKQFYYRWPFRDVIEMVAMMGLWEFKDENSMFCAGILVKLVIWFSRNIQNYHQSNVPPQTAVCPPPWRLWQ